VLVDDRDRRVVQRLDDAVADHVEVQRERVDDQRQQDPVAQQAAQLLDAEVQDVAHFACLRSSAALAPTSTTPATASGTRFGHTSASSSAFAKVPRLIVRKWVVG